MTEKIETTEPEAAAGVAGQSGVSGFVAYEGVKHAD